MYLVLLRLFSKLRLIRNFIMLKWYNLVASRLHLIVHTARINFNYIFREREPLSKNNFEHHYDIPRAHPVTPFLLIQAFLEILCSTPLWLREIWNIVRKMQISFRSLAKEIEDAYAPPIRVSPAVVVEVSGLFVFRIRPVYREIAVFSTVEIHEHTPALWSFSFALCAAVSLTLSIWPEDLLLTNRFNLRGCSKLLAKLN